MRDTLTKYEQLLIKTDTFCEKITNLNLGNKKLSLIYMIHIHFLNLGNLNLKNYFFIT